MRIAIAEDSTILRVALTELLTGRGYEVPVQAGDGDDLLDADVVAQLIGASSTREGITALTAREREALELMAQGRSNTAISQALHVSLGTVEKHVSAIFAKLGLIQADEDHRRVLAVLQYLGVSR